MIAKWLDYFSLRFLRCLIVVLCLTRVGDGFREAVSWILQRIGVYICRRGFESNIVFSYRSYLFLLPTTIRVILDERQIPLVRLRHISAAGRCYEISAAGRCYEISAALNFLL